VYSAQTFDAVALEARFVQAERHSRLVRVLRVGIPGVVAAALGGVLLLSLFNPFRVTSNVTVNTDNLVVSGTKITMEAPHMTGFSGTDQRPYEIWGKTAVQDTADPDNVDLTEPRGKMLAEDGSTMSVESRTGRYNNKAQLLDLNTEVFVQTTNGYEARLNHAQVELATGAVSTDDGVNVKFDGGRVKADRLRLIDRGDVVRFEGRVVMDIDRIENGQPVIPPQEIAPSFPVAPQKKSASKAKAPAPHNAKSVE
jgi:lipopolysaccharide export system protein LptC